jgi:hypothetical protein
VSTGEVDRVTPWLIGTCCLLAATLFTIGIVVPRSPSPRYRCLEIAMQVNGDVQDYVIARAARKAGCNLRAVYSLTGSTVPQ